jgi:hypothetical protein
MGAQPARRPEPPRQHPARALKARSQLRARRREARRRRRLARVDVGLGVMVACVVLLVSAGLAIAALVGLVLLALCVASLVLERRGARLRQLPYTAKKSRSSGSR